MGLKLNRVPGLRWAAKRIIWGISGWREKVGESALEGLVGQAEGFHEAYMDRVHGEGNWTVCWHDKVTQRKVPEGTPNSEKVWHSKAFHDAPMQFGMMGKPMPRVP